MPVIDKELILNPELLKAVACAAEFCTDGEIRAAVAQLRAVILRRQRSRAADKFLAMECAVLAVRCFS